MEKLEHAIENGRGWLESIEEMLAAVDTAATDNERESAEDTIRESVLSVQVRNGWHNPGIGNDAGPEEYEILLSTGGPALRITGHLSAHCAPYSAELQVQDWGTPWTRIPAPEATLLAFASYFWFGE